MIPKNPKLVAQRSNDRQTIYKQESGDLDSSLGVEWKLLVLNSFDSVVRKLWLELYVM